MEQPLITIEMLNHSMEVLSKIYDVVRLVNPYTRKLIIYESNKELQESDFHCYSFWNSKKVCDNCIAMRAFNLKEVFFKLECKKDKIYMVTAIPIKSGNDILVLELLKDVSRSLIVEENKTSGNEILDILNNLNQLQIKDSLTGVFNRRYIEDRLPIDIISNITGNASLSIIFADIDRFKSVNDTYGHIAGDYVLKEFALTLVSSIGKINGWVARYGGEEFLIVLAGCTIDEADNIAEGMRETIESKKIIYNDLEIKITSSFGVTTLPSGISTTPEILIDAADKHLYMAKNNGRNKVISGVFNL